MLKITKNKKNKVLGIDNMNNYYSVKVKKFRNSKLNKYKNYFFFKKDLTHLIKLKKFLRSLNLMWLLI